VAVELAEEQIRKTLFVEAGYSVGSGLTLYNFRIYRISPLDYVQV
jgi:hypothetical protein